MGIGEAETPQKSDKASSSVQEQPTIHPYHDWAAMQAYYGPGVAMPPPYFSTAIASGHAPHPYMWSGQPVMPPFGPPYTAIYAHGVYSHPSVTLGAMSHGQGIPPSSTTSEAVVVATPLTVEHPVKPSATKDKGQSKKLKGLNGLAVPIGSGYAENTARGASNDLSQRPNPFLSCCCSGENDTGASSEGSDGNNEQANKTQEKRSSEDRPTSGKNGKTVRQTITVHGGEKNLSVSLPFGTSTEPGNVEEKPVGALTSSPLEFSVSTPGKVDLVSPSNNPVVLGHDGVPHEAPMQDERALKREKRKQSNRESARRSRLRKQAETEELASKVQVLNTENMTLKSELSRLMENSDKLRLENSVLMEKLKNVKPSLQEEISREEAGSHGSPSAGIENLLAKINHTSSSTSSGHWENETHETSSTKLHQLLDSSPRTDAVVAS